MHRSLPMVATAPIRLVLGFARTSASRAAAACSDGEIGLRARRPLTHDPLKGSV